MKKNLISMLLITATAISLAACGGSKAPASAGSSGTSAPKDTAASVNASQVVVKYSVTYPSTGTQAEGALKLGELIEECSDGRMKMEFYPSSQLGDKARRCGRNSEGKKGVPDIRCLFRRKHAPELGYARCRNTAQSHAVAVSVGKRTAGLCNCNGPGGPRDAGSGRAGQWIYHHCVD